MNSVNQVIRRENQLQEILFINKLSGAIFSRLTKKLREENLQKCLFKEITGFY
jgi:hypothetical protein